MELQIRDHLPFITLTAAYQGKIIEIPNVLIDTGSAGTILNADMLLSIGIMPSEQDILYTIRGVGGTEVVFRRHLDYLETGVCRVPDFEVEIGGMDYGFDINGIIGMDFLILAGAIINLNEMTIEFGKKFKR